MRLNDKASEVLDRYIFAVNRELTGKEREDISKEIESNILDLVEERFPGNGEINRDQLVEILKELGSPRKLAAQYTPQRYLIGPQVYPTFILVLKIVVLAVIGGLTISFIIGSLVAGVEDVLSAVIEYLGSIFSGALSAAGSVVIVFAIIERVGKYKLMDEMKDLDEFKLSHLPELPQNERKFSRAGTIIEIVLGSIGLAFFIYIYANGGLVPFYKNPGSQMQMVPFFTQGFLRVVPLIIAVAALDIMRNSLLLMNGYHNSLTNWWKVGTQVVNIFVFVALITSMPLISLSSPLFSLSTADLDMHYLESVVNMAITIGLAMGLVFGVILDTVRLIISEVRNPIK